eukprot:1160087-Pelagomonas_calceolata.AAC.12
MKGGVELGAHTEQLPMYAEEDRPSDVFKSARAMVASPECTMHANWLLQQRTHTFRLPPGVGLSRPSGLMTC